MGIFDFFKRKASPPPPTEDEPVHAPGWDAITSAFEQLYPGQTSPEHRAPLVHRMHDISKNAAAFDGISAYNAGTHWHFVTFGLSELYDKESEDLDSSGFGFEFTFKLPKLSDKPPEWAFNLLEAIGKAVWDGQIFAAGHTIKTGPIDGRATTAETALLVVTDPAFPEPLATPHGKLELLLLLGVENTYRERVLATYEAAQDAGWFLPLLAELRENNPELVTPVQSQGKWPRK